MALRTQVVSDTQKSRMLTALNVVLLGITALSDLDIRFTALLGEWAAFITRVYVNISAAVITGSGLDDCTSGGTYTGSTDSDFVITVSTAAATDKFTWAKDGGTPSAEIDMTGSAQVISEGFTVTFGATTGHTLADFWTITVMYPG
jgi:hypothetical protein